ncbi:uncharacterized protein [Typha angustifolia]|uniref:uncharacterized protein isoform X1 n=1 Tax=Typha angustifolia TaxID=59011 RepID=UPI003C2E5029
MPFVSSCWLIVEVILLRHKLHKWYYLSFFIHPFLLVCCQLYVVVLSIRRWVSDIVSLTFRFICYVIFIVSKTMIKLKIFLFPVVELENTSFVIPNAHEDVLEHRGSEIPVPESTIQSMDGYRYNRILPITNTALLVLEEKKQQLEDVCKEEPIAYEEEDQEIYGSSPLCIIESNYAMPVLEDEQDGLMDEVESAILMENQEKDDFSSLACIPALPILEVKGAFRKGEVDLFYENYSRRMFWFDQLNTDRRCTVSAILDRSFTNTGFLDSIDPVDLSFPGAAYKKIGKSIENDFELVYVGQACLGWDALYHQYRKVEEFACSERDQNYRLHGNVVSKFQQFHVLLQRFTESEENEGKRFWNYAQRRFSLTSFLQVPEVSGYVEDTREYSQEETVQPKYVLEEIEKAIRVFWDFLKSENSKSLQILNRLIWTDPQVEDPRDLEFFRNISKQVRKCLWPLKKDMELKDLTRKRRKQVRSREPKELQVDIIFGLIDVKLVSRVLKMSVITTQQLNWCQEKLKGMEFKQGKFTRTGSRCLFPD